MKKYEKIEINILGGYLETISKEGLRFTITNAGPYNEKTVKITKDFEIKKLKEMYKEIGMMLKELEELIVVDRI